MKETQHKKYSLEVSGYEIDATCHIMSDHQAKSLVNIKGELGDLSKLGYKIEEQFDNFYLFQDNEWSVNKPLINDEIRFHIIDSNGDQVLNFKLEEITDYIEINTNVNATKYVITPNKSKKNFLLYYEVNKGSLCEYLFQCNSSLKITDFSYLIGKIQHPDGYILFLDRLFYQGQELSISYGSNDVSGKSSFMQIWSHV